MRQPKGFPLDEAVRAVQERIKGVPEVFLVLGSGLGDLAQGVEGAVTIPLQDVPGFPRVGVEGHSGQLVFGVLAGRRVLLQAGRFHFYEGHPPDVVVAPVRMAAGLGAHTVILTNAAGGIAEGLDPGSIMLLDDHLNLMGRNPLTGPVQGSEIRFPDMSRTYDPALREKAAKVALETGIKLKRGIYAAVLGPSYETPAEIRFLQLAGAHAVGMSTVPETITARALGLRVAAFSLITNKAAGLGDQPLDHQEVLDVGKAAGGRLKRLLLALIRNLPPV